MPTEDGVYEVIAGFKRLRRWRRLGLERVPVLVEASRSSVSRLVALLEANRPPRTLTPMDEASVVFALRHEEKLEEALKPMGTEVQELPNTYGLRILEQGRQEGRDEGRSEKQLEVARKALATGMSPQEVANLTDLPLDEVQKPAH